MERIFSPHIKKDGDNIGSSVAKIIYNLMSILLIHMTTTSLLIPLPS